MIDAIIIGAGPAGIAAALRIQQLGGTCIIIDKHSFPRPKACAGMLSSLATRHIPPAVIHQAISGISTEIEWIEGGSRTLIHERNGLTERIHLDHVMATTAIGNGIALLNEQPVKIQPLPDKVNVITNRRKLLSCRAIVCADGANSACRKLMGLPVVSTAFAIEANLPFACNSKRSLFDFDIIAGGYGWFFPRPGFANIGIASMIGTSKGLNTALREFCHKHRLPTPEKNQTHGARIGAYGANTHLGTDTMLLAGDAAGLADPYTGEGISTALLSGSHAGQAIMTSQIPGPTYHLIMKPTLLRLRQRLALAQEKGLACPSTC